jgi:uncharacterized protein YndB with AHSA1/START domain
MRRDMTPTEGHDVDGELEQDGDRWRLRFTRELAHPAETVWQAVTEPRHLEAWFPQRIVGEWTVGGPLKFEAPSGEHPAFDGEVLACDPPTLLEFRWGADVIRFEIKPHAGGAGCTFVLTDAFDELGKAARDSAGWHTCIDALEHHLDGTTPPWTSRERWNEVHAGYVEKFGEAASAIGPPG